MKIDRVAFGKAMAITGLSWLALPIVYYLLIRGKKGKKEEEKEVKEDDGIE